MNPSDIRKALGEAEIFGCLPPSVLDELSRHFKGADVPKGKRLFFEGDETPSIYLAARGRVKIVRYSSEGKEALIEVVPEGRPFALLAGIGGYPLSAGAVAMEKCQLLTIDRERFISLLAAHPELSMAVIQDLVARLRDARDRIRSLSFDRVEQRIARILLALVESLGKRDNGRIFLDVALTRHDIAAMVGTSVETAIRVMSRFQKDSALRTQRGGRIEILDQEKLRLIAEWTPAIGAADGDERGKSAVG